jgi:hypothetical protein
MADTAVATPVIDWENMDVSDIKLCRIDNPNCESCAG